MSGEKRRRPAPSATPWDGRGLEGLAPAEALVAACHRDIYRYRHAPASLEGEAAFLNGYAREACPRCGSPSIKRNGRDSNGVGRWLCRACGHGFNPAAGTVFNGRRIPVADWAEFVLKALSFESVAAMTRSNRRAETTLPYWMAKLFAVLEGVQDGVVLFGRVQIDETLYPLARALTAHGALLVLPRRREGPWPARCTTSSGSGTTPPSPPSSGSCPPRVPAARRPPAGRWRRPTTRICILVEAAG